MSAAHTPGPWEAVASPESVHFDWRVQAKRLYVGICTDNSEGDARLIAAAPELLAALQFAEQMLAHMGGPVEQARAAIARATGSES